MSDFELILFKSICGVSWTIVYVLAIIRGYADKTYAIPMPAIIANLAWELFHSTTLHIDTLVGLTVIIWLLLDALIFIQAVWYGRREFHAMSRITFGLLISGGIVVCAMGIYWSRIKGYGYILSAFPQNLVMSALFIRMLYVRNDVRGQSMYLALFKALGTAAAMAQAAVPIRDLSWSYAITFLGILFFDSLYILLLHRKFWRLGIGPWRRA